MASFVSIPKDLDKIKSKVALNMTKRQLVCFGTAIIIGVPAYLLARGAIGNSLAALLMMGVMSPFFILAMYEKNGLAAEKVLRNYIRTKFFWPGIRPYKTENFYKTIATAETEEINGEAGSKATNSAKPRGAAKKQ